MQMLQTETNTADKELLLRNKPEFSLDGLQKHLKYLHVLY